MELPLDIKIYRLLVEGHSKVRVARFLKISASKVQYHVNKLEKDGFIQRIKGTKSPITYDKARNSYKMDQHIAQYTGTNDDRGGWLVLKRERANVHHLGFRFKVQHDCTKMPPWEQKKNGQDHWTASGVEYRELCIDGACVECSGPIRVREVKGKKDSSIIIWLPEQKISSKADAQHVLSHRVEAAQGVANWLQKQYGYQLGIIEDYAPHVAFAVPPRVADAAMKAGIRSEKFWFDRSNGTGELETKDAQAAIKYLTATEVLDDVMEKLRKLEVENGGLGEAVQELVGVAHHLSTSMAVVADFMVHIYNASNGNGAKDAKTDVPVDERRDVQ